jgi:long-chain acyl-CoA synthetase
MANGLPGSSILDSVVFRKVREATGGRLRFCMTGAAPIAKDTQEFISMAICPMISGYGMTETSAYVLTHLPAHQLTCIDRMGALCDPLAWTTDAHGDIPACIEVKLVDFPEAGYFVTNKPHAQGEIWIRGESVPDSYYQNETETANGMAAGGWFKTGDIGEWVTSGHIKVIDRKKNLVKTLNGEYIALEKVWLFKAFNITADMNSLNPCTGLQPSLQTSASTHRSMRPTPLQLSYQLSQH